MNDFTTGAGATLGIATAAPATYTQAGYEALTFTNVGKITNIGDIPTRVYQEVTISYLEAEGEDVAKGGYSLGSQQITIAVDQSDAGQAMLSTATNSKSPVSVRLQHPVLGTQYRRALVMGGPQTWGDNNTAATQQITLRNKIASLTNDGVVTVPGS